MAALRAIVGLVPVAPEGGNPVGREPEGGNPVGRDLVGREPVGREAVRNGPVFPARAALATGSAALRGQAAPVTAAIAADRVAAVGAVLPALVTVAQGPAAAAPLPPAHTVTPAARPRLRPGRMLTPGALGTGVPGQNLTGARFQVASPGHSSPRRSETVVTARRKVGGTDRRPDVTAQWFRGGTAPDPAARTKLKTSPIPDPFRARLAAQPRPVTTSGQERLGHRVRSRPVVLGWTQVAGAGDSWGLRALRVRPPVAGRPQSAATNGRGRPGEAPVARASLSVAVDVRPSPRAGVVLQTPDVSSGATRSRAARPSGNCLPRT